MREQNILLLLPEQGALTIPKVAFDERIATCFFSAEFHSY
jgi:hypothetical protein